MLNIRPVVRIIIQHGTHKFCYVMWEEWMIWRVGIGFFQIDKKSPEASCPCYIALGSGALRLVVIAVTAVSMCRKTQPSEYMSIFGTLLGSPA